MRMTPSPPAEPMPLPDIDLFDPARYRDADQHAAWHTLREHAPIWSQRTPLGDPFWSVTRYADVSRILMDDKRFSSEHGTILAVARGDSAGGKTINLMDQPSHARVRLPTMRTMSTRLVRDRKEVVRGHIRKLLSDAPGGGEPVDMAAVVLHLPMAGVGEILGIPIELWPDIPRWAMAGVAPSDPEYALGAEADTLRKAHHELIAMFAQLIAQRRRSPADDLISVLLELDHGGRPLDEQELLLNCYSFAMGAITTTPQVASQMLIAFAEQPHAWETLRAKPELIPDAVEEALRWASPTNHLMRRVLSPVEIAGRWLEEGDLVCAWVGSANRDESVFSEPYRFDPARNPNPHLAFGIGAHRCIGGPAAQVALAVLLEELIGRVDRFELAGPVSHLHSNFINGVTRLPMQLHPMRELSTAFVPPRTELERHLAQLWSRRLRVDSIGVHDDFFELGGHSLAAAELLADIQDELGIEVTASTLFLQPSIAELAAVVEAAITAQHGRPGSQA